MKVYITLVWVTGPLMEVRRNSISRDKYTYVCIENSLKFGKPFLAPITSGMPETNGSCLSFGCGGVVIGGICRTFAAGFPLSSSTILGPVADEASAVPNTSR